VNKKNQEVIRLPGFLIQTKIFSFVFIKVRCFGRGGDALTGVIAIFSASITAIDNTALRA
jgi:hypothetical protein